jgi:hypothetical protein
LPQPSNAGEVWIDALIEHVIRWDKVLLGFLPTIICQSPIVAFRSAKERVF